VLHNTGYVLSAGADARVFLGAFLELLLILANLGTAIALYAILRRQSERLSLCLRGGPRARVRVHPGRH
jgi:hypothetical protein